MYLKKMIDFIEAAIRMVVFAVHLHCRMMRRYLFPFGPWTILYFSIVFFVTLFIIVQYDNNPNELRKLIKMDFLPKDFDKSKDNDNLQKDREDKSKNKKDKQNEKKPATDNESIVSDIIASIPSDRDSDAFHSCESLSIDEANGTVTFKDKHDVVFSTGYLEVT